MRKKKEKTTTISEFFVLRASHGEGLEMGYIDFAFRSGPTEDVAENLLRLSKYLKLAPQVRLEIFTSKTAKEIVSLFGKEALCTTK
jgi:hypothetical protein